VKASSIQDIKQELLHLDKQQLVAHCLRLAKYKKDNKELLHFLLFESHDVENYIQQVKEEMNELFTTITTKHAYLAKKTLRKILRVANKHIKYASNKQAEVEWLLHYCQGFKQTGFHKGYGQALQNLYQNQLKKAIKALEGLHEDLQFDYESAVKALL
jgi:hypothetical protein